jgi:hypothetical protein
VLVLVLVRSRCWCLSRLAAREIVRHCVQRGEGHAGMPYHVTVEALQHEQNLRPPRDVGVNRNDEDSVLAFSIDPVELIAPLALDVARTDETMAVRRSFKEEEWRHIVETPVSGKAYQPRWLAAQQRLHPLVRMLGVVDGRPLIPIAHLVGLEVTMHEVVVVLDPLLQ